MVMMERIKCDAGGILYRFWKQCPEPGSQGIEGGGEGIEWSCRNGRCSCIIA